VARTSIRPIETWTIVSVGRGRGESTDGDEDEHGIEAAGAQAPPARFETGTTAAGSGLSGANGDPLDSV